MSKIKELLCVTEDDINKVRKSYEKTEKDIESDLSILLDWLRKQPHLPNTHDESRLERFLLRNKFRIEQAKKKQDNYYTYRALYPEFFLHMNPESDPIQNVRKSIMCGPMPKLLPTMERLYAFSFVANQDEHFNFTHVIGYVLMILDLQLSHDYAVAERYICDCNNLTLKHVFRVDPNALHKALLVHQHAFSGRISRMEFINLPPAWDVLLNLLKRVMDAKLASKIRAHNNLESLYAVLPKEYLPEDFGGEQPSMRDIHENWGKETIAQREFLEENANRISNEKLRVGKSIKNELFGIDGTFRKINID